MRRAYIKGVTPTGATEHMKIAEANKMIWRQDQVGSSDNGCIRLAIPQALTCLVERD